MDPYLLQDLVERAPSLWPSVLARYEATSYYLSLRKPSAEIAERLANELGVGQLWFERLAKARKRQLKGKFKRRPYKGERQKTVSAEHEQIIQQALAEKSAWGVTATYRRALKISLAAGVTPPTTHGVRSRFRTAQSLAEIQSCVGKEIDWVVDCCELEVATTEFDRVYLLVLINVPTGVIAGHCVAFGEVSPIDLLAVFIGLRTGSAQPTDATRVGVMPVLYPLLDEVSEQLSQQGLQLLGIKAQFKGCGRGTSAGEMLMRLFGKKIGGIAFRTRGSLSTGELPRVTRSVLKSVIAELVDQRNERLRDHSPDLPEGL